MIGKRVSFCFPNGKEVFGVISYEYGNLAWVYWLTWYGMLEHAMIRKDCITGIEE